MNTIFGLPAATLLTTLAVTTALILGVVLLSALRFPLAFRLGIRNLPRRKSQTILIVSGLALSTLIVTSALGIGDTVDYSVKSQVYRSLGAIDLQAGLTRLEAQGGFAFTGAPAESAPSESWFDAPETAILSGLEIDPVLDGIVLAVIQNLPGVAPDTGLSVAGLEVRGLGTPLGSGLAAPSGLADLESGQVLVNQSLASALALETGNQLLLIKGMPAPFEVAGIVGDGELSGSRAAVIMPLEQAQALFGQTGKVTAVYFSAAGGVEASEELYSQAAKFVESQLPGLVINPIKQDQLKAAATNAETITNLFVTFGTFSIASGILLIFLIFSVLAAERKSELGMSRAVGLQRGDLVRQFVTEGLGYNLIAAGFGAALGVLAAVVLANAIGGLLGGGSIDLSPRVSPRSVVIGYTMGVVITFFTVLLSAVRISKVNIIAAIRDLNLPTPPRLPQWTLFLRPFTVWKAALQKAGQGNFSEALRLFVLAGPKSILSFWAGLAARGPVLIVLGYATAWAGVNQAKLGGVYGMGVSIFIIGLGQLMNWLRLPSRLAYTFVGLALVLYWSLPVREIGRLAELGNNPGDFFISGIFLVGGAIMLFLYNADTLLNLFAGLLGRAGRLLPVARVSIAYPVSNKGRTATTLAMFSLIIFTLISTATITNTFSNFLDVEAGSGGYDLLVQTNPFNPVTQEAFTEKVDGLIADGQIARPEAVASVLFAPVQAQSPDMTVPANYAIQALEGTFFESHGLELSAIARGYNTPEQVWAALQEDASLVVIDNFSIDRSGAPGYTRDENTFYIGSVKASDTSFEAVNITISGQDGSEREMTVIGVLRSAPNFFGALMNSEGAASLGYTGYNRYFVRLPEGSDVQAADQSIRGAFARQGVQTTLLKAQLEESQASTKGVFYLIQGFVGLGLLIGIAALGVITIRAVVERRQQIGVLRAIGFQRQMVQNVFLLESLFIAGLGALIGYGLGLTFAYNLYLQVAADQGLAFLPPWPALLAIGATIFAASLLTAWLPARATSQVVIAEALRYE
jgi:putative ABC transport system permease protein